MSGLATKQQSLKLFEKLKTKQANKVSSIAPLLTDDLPSRVRVR